MIGGLQTSPFKVQGKFETNQTMNVRYVVEPRDQWESLSRYNSFVCKSLVWENGSSLVSC